MTPLVLKFGGTSVASPERLRQAAAIVAAERARRPVAVVVSAMAGETDRLLGLARDLGGEIGEAETDVALASGEQTSAALTALALKEAGLAARSLLAWQLPIAVEGPPGGARITGVDPGPLRALIEAGVVPVVAGYQGIAEDGRLATLGRGGTDLTAAAVAAAIGGDCDIYTDVDGVYTTDPRIAPEARRVERISHDEMLELAAMGAKVLQSRSVEYAKARNVALRVRSSFLEPGASEGTTVVAAEGVAERRVVSGVAYARDQARLAVMGLPESGEGAAALFAALAEADVHVDMIVQARARAGGVNLEFSVERRDLDRALAAADALDLAGAEISHETDLAKVSVVGVGLRGRADIARTLYAVLGGEGIAVRMVATSEIKISALVEADLLEKAVRALHAAYKLEEA
ncbi:aspartate kinase [Marinicauda salina]|uniref:Aspartokinase n=1 Tax=Marinicauda salina TaxID=2135793 RepID=A0A2U2BS21_9PROT|nr:aspartate kinase [Marinicauda salina]PWE16799.1 aspartate kinase [Marinicauda salina]